MGLINQDPDLSELTIKRGCFNCKQFKNCPNIRTEKNKSRNFSEILIFGNGEEFRYGCCCGSYEAGIEKEKVEFT